MFGYSEGLIAGKELDNKPFKRTGELEPTNEPRIEHFFQYLLT